MSLRQHCGDIEEEVFKILKKKKNISDIVPKVRSKRQEQELKACYKKLKLYPFPYNVIEGL